MRTEAEEPTEKVERLSIADVRKPIARQITDAMVRFTKLGDRIDVLTAAQKKIREDEVIPLFVELGTQKLEEFEEGGGWYVAERPGKKSFDKEKAIRLLTSKGVDPTLAKKCFKAAEKPGKAYVEVSRRERKKEVG